MDVLFSRRCLESDSAMKLVVLDGGTLNPGDNPWIPLENLGDLTVYESTASDQTVSRSADAEILLTNKVVLDSHVIGQLPNLKMIAVTATGYNVVDVEAANAQGVVVANVPVYSTRSVAQHVFAMLLEFYHRATDHHNAIGQGQWQASGQFSFWLNPIEELAGKKFGVIGFGRIGQATARVAQAFGMEILIHSRTSKEVDGFASATWMPLEEVFENADVVSLHCPQTNSNAQFVNQTLIARMKSTALLINTARGGLINESDLAAALNDWSIGGACLDVLSCEPPADNNPLLTADRCLLTPHVAWTALQARQRLMQITADNIRAFIAGSPQNLV